MQEFERFNPATKTMAELITSEMEEMNTVELRNRSKDRKYESRMQFLFFPDVDVYIYRDTIYATCAATVFSQVVGLITPIVHNVVERKSCQSGI